MAHRVLHGRPRPGRHRRLGPYQRNGSRGRGSGNRTRGRTAHGGAPPGGLARPTSTWCDRARLRRRPPPSSRPRDLSADHGSQGRSSDRGDPAGRGPRMGAPVGPDRTDLSGRLRDPVRRRQAASNRPDRGSGRDGVGRARVRRRRREGSVEPGAGPREDRRRRTAPRDGTGRARVRVRLWTAARGAGVSVAHDAHNIVVVGMSDREMAFAVERLAELGGGIVAVDGLRVMAELALPVAGLLAMPRSPRSSNEVERATMPRTSSAGPARRRS